MSTEITEYDPSWPSDARRACEELTGALPGLFADIEHVGSTSVPGLAAKPVIDLMASVAALEDVTPDREAALEGLGYARHDTGMPERIFFYRDDAAGRRSRHLHIVTTDSWATRNERLLRDHLLANPAAVEEYAQLKRRLVADGHDGLEYTKAKTDLVQRLVDRERGARGLPAVPVWEE